MSQMMKTLPLMIACALTANVAYAAGSLTGAAGHDVGVTLTPTNVNATNAKANSAGDIAIGLSSNASGAADSNNIAVGTGAKVGAKTTDSIAVGTGARAHGGDGGANIAIGKQATTGNNRDDDANPVNTNVKNGIAIGNNANVGGSNYLSGAGVQDGIAIGRNARAQANSVHIGSNDNQPSNQNNRLGATSVGHNIQNEGNYSTVMGANSAIDVDVPPLSLIPDVRGAASVVSGAYNTVNATDAGKDTNGVAVAVTGTLNNIKNSHGVTVTGTGNKVEGAYTTLTAAEVLAMFTAGTTADAAQTAANALTADKIGAVDVVGNLNTVTNSTSASVIGTKNTVSGSKDVIVAGRGNTVATVTSGIIMGNDNTAVGNANNVISLGDKNTVSANDAVALGSGTTVSQVGGVALGQGSVADRAAIVAADAYVPTGADAAQKAAVEATVVGSAGAVSVGSTTATRQITNVAAGSQDSDAVNVAQLKAVQAQSASTGTAITGLENRVGRLESNLVETDRDLRGGIAGSNALAALQQAQPGQSMVSVGVGGYRGASAVAVGLATSQNGISFRAGVSVNNRKDVNWGGSLGYAW